MRNLTGHSEEGLPNPHLTDLYDLTQDVYLSSPTLATDPGLELFFRNVNTEMDISISTHNDTYISKCNDTHINTGITTSFDHDIDTGIHMSFDTNFDTSIEINSYTNVDAKFNTNIDTNIDTNVESDVGINLYLNNGVEDDVNGNVNFEDVTVMDIDMDFHLNYDLKQTLGSDRNDLANDSSLLVKKVKIWPKVFLTPQEHRDRVFLSLVLVFIFFTSFLALPACWRLYNGQNTSLSAIKYSSEQRNLSENYYKLKEEKVAKANYLKSLEDKLYLPTDSNRLARDFQQFAITVGVQLTRFNFGSTSAKGEQPSQAIDLIVRGQYNQILNFLVLANREACCKKFEFSISPLDDVLQCTLEVEVLLRPEKRGG